MYAVVDVWHYAVVDHLLCFASMGGSYDMQLNCLTLCMLVYVITFYVFLYPLIWKL